MIEVTPVMWTELHIKMRTKPVALFNPDLLTKILHGKCATCSVKITELRDEGSLREYMIGGMCQNCQDEIFGTGTFDQRRMSDEDEYDCPEDDPDYDSVDDYHDAWIKSYRDR